jgi:putative hemolysin
MIDTLLALEILLIVGLILLNGVFAMSEIAVVSARKTRLQHRAEEGDRGARRALRLAENPTRFLSTVQVGITLIGVFAGAYGGASLAGQLDQYLQQFPLVQPYSEEIALATVVALITFFSLVAGELVPKRIALNHPESIASFIAGPMDVLSRVAAPAVKLLTLSTDGIVRVLRISKSDEPPVTERELSALLEAGTAAGVFEEDESEMVEGVLSLGDKQVAMLMTPRNRIQWLDVNDPDEAHRKQLIEHRHSHYLVCDAAVDNVVGMVHVKDLLAGFLASHSLEPTRALRKPLFVPPNVASLRLLEMFRESGIHVAVVIDEYGGVGGLVTLNDVLEEITGGLSSSTDLQVVQRENGSWLVDAALTVDEFWDALDLPERRSEERHDYNTLGGLALSELGRIPKTGDTFVIPGLHFEVVDMDGHRVDKLLVTRLWTKSSEEEQDG